MKIHVRHKLTGTEIPIPASLIATGEWKLFHNWFECDAEFVDAEGFGRKIFTFKPIIPGPTMVDWIDFAGRKAAGLADSHPQHVGLQALERVSRNMCVRQAPSLPGLVTLADEPLTPP